MNRCPQCENWVVRKHCPSPKCDWVACAHCGGYGWANGKRWVRGTKADEKRSG